MKLHRLKLKIQDLHPALYIVLFLLLSFLCTIISSVIIFLLEEIGLKLENNTGPQTFLPKGPWLLFIACIVAPLFETWLLQMLPINYLKRYFSDIKIVFISALLFGLMNWYSVVYMAHTFMIGVILALGYIL